jgi:hypothetical protein
MKGVELVMEMLLLGLVLCHTRITRLGNRRVAKMIGTEILLLRVRSHSMVGC